MINKKDNVDVTTSADDDRVYMRVYDDDNNPDCSYAEWMAARQRHSDGRWLALLFWCVGLCVCSVLMFLWLETL